jgi:hypothetical protein
MKSYDPSAAQRLDTAEARHSAIQIADLITPQGARCSKRQGLHLAHLVRMLCDALEQARLELRQRETYQDLYGALVADYNALIGALRSLGIEIYQPSGSDRWHWSYGPQTGAAPTVAGAAAQALRACGAIPWHDDAAYADEAAQRAAQQAEAPDGS